MVKRFLKDGIFYSLVSILSRGISFLLLPIYTHILSPADFGAIDMLTLLGIILNLIVAFEIMQGVARFLPETENDEQKVMMLSSSLWFTVFMYALTGVVLWLFEKEICTLLMDDLKWLPTYRIAIVSLILNGIFLFFQNALRWQLLARYSGVISFLYSLTTASVAVLLVAYYQMGVEGIYWGYIAGAVIAIATGYFLNRRFYVLKFSWSVTKKLLHFSIPLLPSSASVFLAMYIDRVIIKEYLGLAELGLYAIAVKFASMVGLIIVGFSSALTPLVYQEYKNPETPRKISEITNVYFAAAFVLIAFFSLLSNEVLFFFTERKFYVAAPLIPWLTFNMVISYAYIFAPGLSIAKKTGWIAVINITTGLLNFFLNVFLVKSFGLHGAIAASFITTCTGFAANLYFSQRNYFIPFRAISIFLFFACAILIMTVGSMISNEVSWIWFFIRGSILTVTLLAVGTAIVGWARIKSVFSQ